MDEFDLRVISLGAGVQSTTLYLRACRGDFGRPPDLGIFADTQQERGETMKWLDVLEEIGGKVIPIVRATAGDLAVDALHSMRETPSRFLPIPAYCAGEKREGMGRRQCTRTHKIKVVYEEIRRRLGLTPGEAGAGKFAAEVWIGISTDEATRAKDSRYPILVNRFPLLHDLPTSRADCRKWLRAERLHVPVKSSCVFCPYKADADWIELQQDDPEGWERATAFEREINAEGHFLHWTLKPLEQVHFDPSRQLDLFQNDCEGMCGV